MSTFRSILFTIFALVLIVAFAPEAWMTLRGGWYLLFGPQRPSNAVNSAETAAELAAKGLRNQLVTFDNMETLDHGKYELFALGVGQLSLNKPESVKVTGSRYAPREDYASNSPLTTVRPGAGRTADDIEASRPHPVYGNFNNILLFDRKANSFTTVFNQRIAIASFQTGWRTPQEVLIIFGSETDTNHDGELDNGDLADLYVYSIADRQLHRIVAPGMSAGQTYDIPNADYLIVQYRVDRNHDGKIGTTYGDTDPEPSVFMRVDLKTFEAKPFVPDEITRSLQTTLEQPSPPAKP